MHTIRDYSLKNTLDDMTVGEFEKMSAILRDESRVMIERYIDIMIELGMPEELLNDLTDEELFAAIRSFTATTGRRDLIPDFELGGYRYVAYPTGGSYAIKARDLAMIERAIKNDPAFLSRTLAIVFKREDLSATEHYTDAHITHKAKLFSSLSAGDFYPYLLAITESMNKHLNNDTASDTDSATQGVG